MAGLIDALERAQLRGHGGGSFPTATKLQAVAAQHGAAVVVVNAAEGEPLSGKDRYLLESQADAVLDGAVAAALEIGANRITFAIDEHLKAGIEQIRVAIAGRTEFAGRRGLKATVTVLASGYVVGQETALVAALEGREPKPTLTPPYPFEHGVHGRPTLVSNVETYLRIGQVAGGTYDGTRLASIGGGVALPGLVEIAPTTTLSGAVTAAGGLSENVIGVLFGGYAGVWAAPADVMTLTLNEQSLREHRLTLGPGILFLLGESACPVNEVARVTRWMAGQSARQCGPCVHGLSAIASALWKLTETPGSPSAVTNPELATGTRAYSRLRRWCAMVQRRGACAHPDGVARFVTSALDTFTAAFEDHAAYGGCGRCGPRGVLPVTANRERARMMA